MIAEYDVRTKTESIRRHRKIILDDTFSGGFDKPEIRECLAYMVVCGAVSGVDCKFSPCPVLWQSSGDFDSSVFEDSTLLGYNDNNSNK
jgi:hypothetical protein